jgi:hypothetical protein
MSELMEFWTTLIKVRRTTSDGAEALRANCTHVTGPYWIMEGDLDYLREAGVRFSEVAQGVVGSLGDLSEEELREVCLRSYGVRL